MYLLFLGAIFYIDFLYSNCTQSQTYRMLGRPATTPFLKLWILIGFGWRLKPRVTDRRRQLLTSFRELEVGPAHHKIHPYIYYFSYIHIVY